MKHNVAIATGAHNDIGKYHPDIIPVIAGTSNLKKGASFQMGRMYRMASRYPQWLKNHC